MATTLKTWEDYATYFSNPEISDTVGDRGVEREMIGISSKRLNKLEQNTSGFMKQNLLDLLHKDILKLHAFDVTTKIDSKHLIGVEVHVVKPGAPPQSFHCDNLEEGKNYATVLVPLTHHHGTAYEATTTDNPRTAWQVRGQPGRIIAHYGDEVHAGPLNDTQLTRRFIALIFHTNATYKDPNFQPPDHTFAADVQTVTTVDTVTLNGHPMLGLFTTEDIPKNVVVTKYPSAAPNETIANSHYQVSVYVNPQKSLKSPQRLTSPSSQSTPDAKRQKRLTPISLQQAAILDGQKWVTAFDGNVDRINGEDKVTVFDFKKNRLVETSSKLAQGIYANHSIFPNAELYEPTDDARKDPTAEHCFMLRAMQLIPKDSQVFVNYGDRFPSDWLTAKQAAAVTFAEDLLKYEAMRKKTGTTFAVKFKYPHVSECTVVNDGNNTCTYEFTFNKDQFKLNKIMFKKATLKVFYPNGEFQIEVPVPTNSYVFEVNEGNDASTVSFSKGLNENAVDLTQIQMYQAKHVPGAIKIQMSSKSMPVAIVILTPQDFITVAFADMCANTAQLSI